MAKILITGHSTDIDDALSPTSENAVQNKVVTGAIEGLQDQIDNIDVDIDTDDVANVSGVDGTTVTDAFDMLQSRSLTHIDAINPHGTKVINLNDFDNSTPIVEGQTIILNNEGIFIPTDFPTSSVSGLTDVDETGKTNGSILKWDNTTEKYEMSTDYLTDETDPIFAASAAGNITSGDIASWNGKADVGDSYLKANTFTKNETTELLTALFTPGGSKDAAFVATAANLVVANKNKIYNITEVFETNANFIDFIAGEPYTYPTGSNVAIIEVVGTPNTYKFDVYGGIYNAATVGLGNVKNYDIASRIDAEDGTADDKYMTPERTKQAINELGLVPEGTPSEGKIIKYNENFGLWTVSEETKNLIYATANDFPVYPTPGFTYTALNTGLTYYVEGQGSSAVCKSIMPVLGESSTTAYAGDKGKVAYDHSQSSDNPHGVTKSNVALGNVDNFATASQAQAEDGESDSTFMTPERTKNAIDVHDRGINSHGKLLNMLFGTIVPMLPAADTILIKLFKATGALPADEITTSPATTTLTVVYGYLYVYGTTTAISRLDCDIMSSDESVATIDKYGTIKRVKKGKFSICVFNRVTGRSIGRRDLEFK